MQYHTFSRLKTARRKLLLRGQMPYYWIWTVCPQSMNQVGPRIRAVLTLSGGTYPYVTSSNTSLGGIFTGVSFTVLAGGVC